MRTLRRLTIAEQEVKAELYRRKKARELPHGYVTTTAPVPMGSTDGKGPWNGNPKKIIPPGTTLKIVMVSSMGDCGLTDDLNADVGYQVRLDWEDAAMTNIRLQP